MGTKTNKNTIFGHIACLAMGILMVLSAVLVFPYILPRAHAASAPVSSESTIAVSTEDIVVDAKVLPDGSSSFHKASSNLSIKTNNYSGYTLRIVAEDGDTYNKLINSAANTFLESITEATSEQDFKDEASFLGKFGYSPSKLASSDNTDFLPAPDTTGDVLDVTSAANFGEGEENTYTISLGAKVDMSIIAGEYVNTYIYEVVANPTPYLITYDENTTDTVANIPSAQEDDTSSDSIALDDTTPERDHYDFLGWCEGTTTNTVTEQDDIYTCDGTVYQPGDTFYLDQTTGNQVELKAMWEIHKNRLDINGRLDGADAGNIANYGTVDVYINGNQVSDDVTDYAVYWKYGTTYEVTDIKANTGKQYDGVQTSFPLFGTIGEEYVDLRLIFSSTVYAITLNRNGGDNGSTSTTVKYGDTSLGSITTPTRSNTTETRTVSGFSRTSSAANASISSSSTLNSTRTTTYSFTGWYKESGATNKIAGNTATPALEANTSYTNASKQWTSTSNQTLYAGWSSSTGNYTTVTLPTITRTGSTCGWSTSSSATTIDNNYTSGKTITPSGNLTLYGVCVTNISLNRNGGNAGSTSTTVNYGSTTMASITVPTRSSSSYTVSGFGRTSSGANSSISSTATLTSTQTYSFKGWYTAASGGTNVANTAASPALTASNGYTNGSKQWTYTTASAVTFYAQWNASGFSSVKLPTVTRTGSTCGWATSSSATSWNYTSGQTITPSGNLTLYAVCRNDITLDRNGGNAGSTSTTATYGATTLGSITTPTRSNTSASRTVAFGRGTNASSASISSTSTLTSTNTTSYSFKGWYTAASGGTNVANTAASPALTASNGYTNGSKQWTYTTASAVKFYAQWNSSSTGFGAVKLPTISRTGYTCGWSTASNASSINYSSGANYTPSGNTTLYGTCIDSTKPSPPTLVHRPYAIQVNYADDYIKFWITAKSSDTSGSNITYSVGTNEDGTIGSATCANNTNCSFQVTTRLRPSSQATSHYMHLYAQDASGNLIDSNAVLGDNWNARRLYMAQVYNGIRAAWGDPFSVSDAELTNKVNLALNNRAATVVKDMFRSDEATGFFSGKSADFKCNAMYYAILGRAPDSEGFNTCKSLVNSSGYSMTKLATFYVNSTEAQTIFSRLGFVTGAAQGIVE